MSAKRRGNARDTTRGPPAGVDSNHKRMESERISEQIADFERCGGRVEKLGTTRVLLKLDLPTASDATPPPKPAAHKRTR